MGKWGGSQPNAGRKKGFKTKATLEREAVLKAVKERIMTRADRLIDAQSQLALGQSFLYVIRTVTEGKVRRRLKAELIESPSVIKQYLDGEFEGLEDEYYYITAKEPNNMAIDSLTNRAFGKPEQSMDLTTNGNDLTPISNLDDDQLDKLISAVQRTVGGTAAGEAPADSGKSPEVRETPPEAA